MVIPRVGILGVAAANRKWSRQRFVSICGTVLQAMDKSQREPRLVNRTNFVIDESVIKSHGSNHIVGQIGFDARRSRVHRSS